MALAACATCASLHTIAGDRRVLDPGIDPALPLSVDPWNDTAQGSWWDRAEVRRRRGREMPWGKHSTMVSLVQLEP
jgi:hypothetical protein